MDNQDSKDGGIIAEVLSKHGHSAQPESQQLIAVLNALRDVIASESLPCTPTSFFAAGMSALEKPETRSSTQVCQAMCTLLGIVLPRVPNAVIRSKWGLATNLITTLLKEHHQQAGVVKAGLLVLSQLLSALDPSPEAWPAAAGPWALLLSALTDSRAKVRKRASSGMLEVLAALQPSPTALNHASDALAKLSAAVLAQPEAAARAAAAASNKQRSAAEDAIAQAVSDSLHLLGALKTALPLMSAEATKVVVDLLFKLYPLRQPLLTRHATDALACLVSSPSNHLSSRTLSEVMNVVMDSGEMLWDRKDADVVLQLTRLLEGGCCQLAQSSEPGLAAAQLPRIVHMLMPQLASAQEGVRHGVSMALRNIIRGCIDVSMYKAAVAGPASGRAAQPALVSVIAAVASGLGARYQEGWTLAITVVMELLEVLGQLHTQSAAGSPAKLASLAEPLLRPLGAFVAGEEDASDTVAPGEAAPSGEVADAAANALGNALRCLGPPVVLTVLPLQIREQLSGQPNAPEPRTWMLPLLRRHVAGATLGYWGEELMPLARELATRSTAAATAGQANMAQTLHVLELQLWATLPAFISFANDLPTSFEKYSKEGMAGAFTKRDDLRGWVCAALERAALQARQVLVASPEHQHLVGFADPLGAQDVGEEDDNDDEYGYKPSRARSVISMRNAANGKAPSSAGNAHDAPHHLQPPESYTPALAAASVTALRTLSMNWLLVLSKAFLAAPPESRGALARTISAYSAISEPSVIAECFRKTIERLLKVIKDAAADVPPADIITDGGNTPIERRCAFMELGLCLAAGLPDEALETLLKAAAPTIQDASEPALQKKGYKVLAYLCGCRPSFLRSHLVELLHLVVSGTPNALSAAKRYRLRCLKPLILALAGSQHIPADQLPAVPGGASKGDQDDDDMDGQSEDSDSDDESGRKPKPAASKPAGHAADPDQKRKEIMSVLVSELMLCCKEANKKTRAAGYQLLVQVAHAMDEMSPGPLGNMGGDDGSMDLQDDGPQGGLATLFMMIMAGLAGQTPHMISASVMALARLLYEFAYKLEPLVPELLPAVTLLLRSKSREVVKSVLGFIKVCTIRMPSDLLKANLPQLLEGMLIWAKDTKNKFSKKVSVNVERLVKRCGMEEVEKHFPESDRPLLTAIRKRFNKKQRMREGGSQAGDEGDDAMNEDARSRRSAGQSSAGRTARTGKWAHTEIFSDDDDEDDHQGETAGPRSAKGGRGPASMSGKTAAARRGRHHGSGALVESLDEPMDLLDMSATRQLVKTAAGVRRHQGQAGDEDDYNRNPEGKMIINDDDELGRQRARRKRGRGDDDYNSEDSDYEDMRDIAGLDAAIRDANRSSNVQRAMSVKSGAGKSISGRSQGGKSAGGRTVGDASKKGPSLHSGDRFKAKGSTGGDVKGRAKVEPYAYWQFDRKMLNRRPAKKRQASKSLTGVIGGAAAGAAKGAKARGRANAKRARNE